MHYVDCRHQRRRVGTRARLLSDDRRRAGSGPRLDPIFATLAPGVDSAPRDPGRAKRRAARRSRLSALRPERRRPLRQDGPQRHRVRADGRLRRGPQHPASTRTSASSARAADAETTPLRDPEYYQYDFDLADIAEVWRRGSVVASWLLDLTAAALARDPDARGFWGRCPIRAKVAGRSSRRSTRRCRPTS